MKHFLAVFTGTPEMMEKSGWSKLTEQERQERTERGIAAWNAWMQERHERIVVAGSPVGKTKRVDAAGVSDGRNAICGYVVVAADSHQAAAALFERHPHFSIFPGEAVEVMECLPVPGMDGTPSCQG